MKLRPAGTQDPDAIQISQSALEAWFTCPAKLKYMSQYQRDPLPTALQDGIDAHALLSQQEAAAASVQAIGYFESLWDLKCAYNIELYKQEFTQVLDLGEGIYFKRIIDGIGEWQGRPVLIDWKTSGKGEWPWFRRGKEKVVPKSMSFQAVGYLIPPDDNDDWPDTILFLVSDAAGHGNVYAYSRDLEREAEFMDACRLVAHSIRNDLFPHYRGQACGQLGASWACTYLEKCYALPGHEDLFKTEVHEGEER
jgi:hypothetical protein